MAFDLYATADSAYMGLTAYIGDRPYLIIGKSNKGYILEGEEGDTLDVNHEFLWEPSDDNLSSLIAASRVEGSPLARGERIRGLLVGDLIYDGNWHVRVGNTEVTFPIAEAIEVLADHNWNKEAITLAPHPQDDKGICPRCGSDEVYSSDYASNPNFAECADCGWHGPADALEYPGYDPDPDRYASIPPDDALSDGIRQARKLLAAAGYSIQGAGVIAGPAPATGIVVRLDSGKSREQILAEIDTLPSHEDDALKQKDYFKDQHGWGYYDNPYINRGGSVKETADFRPAPGGQGVTMGEGFILVNRWFSPDDNWIMYNSKCQGIIAQTGGATSHAVVVAREANIPCIVDTGEAINLLRDGDHIVMDGESGVIHGNGGDPNFQAGETKKAKEQVKAFIWWNGHHEVIDADPTNDKQHEGIIESMLGRGEFDFDDNASGGVYYSDGSLTVFNKVPDQAAFEQWLDATFHPTHIEYVHEAAVGDGKYASIKLAEAVTIPYPPKGYHNTTREVLIQEGLNGVLTLSNGEALPVPDSNPMLFIKYKMQTKMQQGIDVTGEPTHIESDRAHDIATVVLWAGQTPPDGGMVQPHMWPGLQAAQAQGFVATAKTAAVLYVIQGYYGKEYGWEDVDQSDDPAAAKENLRLYNENEPEYPHRLVKRNEASIQKGAPYPEKSYENAPDHTPKKQKKSWPKEVNAIYNACMREDKGRGDSKDEKESSCAAIAWAQYDKNGGKPKKSDEKESSIDKWLRYIKVITEEIPNLSPEEIASRMKQAGDINSPEEEAEVIEYARKLIEKESSIESFDDLVDAHIQRTYGAVTSRGNMNLPEDVYDGIDGGKYGPEYEGHPVMCYMCGNTRSASLGSRCEHCGYVLTIRRDGPPSAEGSLPRTGSVTLAMTHEAADEISPVKCPECKSHTYRILRLDKSKQKAECECLRCGNHYKHDVLVSESAHKNFHNIQQGKCDECDEEGPISRLIDHCHSKHPDKIKSEADPKRNGEMIHTYPITPVMRSTVGASWGSDSAAQDNYYHLHNDDLGGVLCPNCGKNNLYRVEGDHFYCPDCDSDWDSSSLAEGQEHLGTKSSSWLDVNGAPMESDKWYTMYSTQWTVPDVVKIVDLEGGRIRAHIEGDTKGLFPITVESSEIETNGYTFEPYVPKPENDLTIESKFARRNFTQQQQKELVNENLDGRARNYSKLDLAGTHYTVDEELDENDPVSKAFLF